MSFDKLDVLAPAAFSRAIDAIAAGYERVAGISVIYGPASGDAPNSIPSRIKSGDSFDVVVAPRAVIDDLAASQLVSAQTVVDVMRSSIAACVKTGSTLPDISTPQALKQALLATSRVALSKAGSGVFVSQTLFERLGIVDAMRDRCITTSEPVAAVVARGDASLGFQQLGELLNVGGVTVLGQLSTDCQNVTTISAAIPAACVKRAEAARFMVHLFSDEAKVALSEAGLEPVSPQPLQ